MKTFMIAIDIFLILCIIAMKIAEDSGFHKVAKIINHIFTIIIAIVLIICYIY